MNLFKNFIRGYLELPEKRSSIVCIGGGNGTAQVLRGLKTFNVDLTAIVSIADNGGSAGRLRRAFDMPPPGDIINCLAALSDDESVLRELLLYRFEGNRYGADNEIGGQKLGNLIMLALSKISGDFSKAIFELSKLVSPRGQVLTASKNMVDIWAETEEGVKVHGEENIDLGKYDGSRSLRHVYLEPTTAPANPMSVGAIEAADLIVIGPGDLYSTVLPSLLVKGIGKAIEKSKATKIYITNVTNKNFETPNYKISDYVKAIERHVGKNFFDAILVNTNQKVPLPSKYTQDYHYVIDDSDKVAGYKILRDNFINRRMPLHHDSVRVAETLLGVLKS